MCLSSSKSSQSSEVRDERVGADNGATAFRASGTNTISVGSDDTAQLAIESSTNALTATTDLIGGVLTEFFNSSDKRLEAADNNIAKNQQLTADLLKNEQETSDDRLIQIFQLLAVGGVAVVALQSGFLKDLRGVFK